MSAFSVLSFRISHGLNSHFGPSFNSVGGGRSGTSTTACFVSRFLVGEDLVVELKRLRSIL